MTFEEMNHGHIENAARIALAEYYEERRAVPILPEGEYLSVFCNMISEMVDHKLGIAAIEGGKLAGFMTCYSPMENHFGTTLGIFSPIHAHGTVKENRRRIYSLIYQAAADKWVKQGILSHAIALYTHDKDAVDSFFWNGFGLRCIDSIREVGPIIRQAVPIINEKVSNTPAEYSDIEFCELHSEEVLQVLPLKNLLIKHLWDTPMFIPLFFQLDKEGFGEETEERNSRFFAIKASGKVIAFIEITASGENFACEDAGMMNICGAYMLPQYRESGMFSKLLSFLMDTLSTEGYIRCGVDFESFNPTASGFWLKYFTPYTYSVVRRIDERITRNTGLIL